MFDEYLEFFEIFLRGHNNIMSSHWHMDMELYNNLLLGAPE